MRFQAKTHSWTRENNTERFGKQNILQRFRRNELTRTNLRQKYGERLQILFLAMVLSSQICMSQISRLLFLAVEQVNKYHKAHAWQR